MPVAASSIAQADDATMATAGVPKRGCTCGELTRRRRRRAPSRSRARGEREHGSVRRAEDRDEDERAPPACRRRDRRARSRPRRPRGSIARRRPDRAPRHSRGSRAGRCRPARRCPATIARGKVRCGSRVSPAEKVTILPALVGPEHSDHRRAEARRPASTAADGTGATWLKPSPVRAGSARRSSAGAPATLISVVQFCDRALRACRGR